MNGCDLYRTPTKLLKRDPILYSSYVKIFNSFLHIIKFDFLESPKNNHLVTMIDRDFQFIIRRGNRDFLSQNINEESDMFEKRLLLNPQEQHQKEDTWRQALIRNLDLDKISHTLCFNLKRKILSSQDPNILCVYLIFAYYHRLNLDGNKSTFKDQINSENFQFDSDKLAKSRNLEEIDSFFMSLGLFCAYRFNFKSICENLLDDTKGSHWVNKLESFENFFMKIELLIQSLISSQGSREKFIVQLSEFKRALPEMKLVSTMRTMTPERDLYRKYVLKMASNIFNNDNTQNHHYLGKTHCLILMACLARSLLLELNNSKGVKYSQKLNNFVVDSIRRLSPEKVEFLNTPKKNRELCAESPDALILIQYAFVYSLFRQVLTYENISKNRESKPADLPR